MNVINFIIIIKTKSIQNQTHYLRNFITAIISILCTLIGGLSVYAAFGGTISGKPVIHWLGFNISNNYDKYKETVVDQQVSYNETKDQKIHNIFINGKGYYAKTFQTTNKITDNEYKVYQLYLLTDEILKEKKEFKVELKNIVLKNTADQTANKNKHCFYLSNTPDNEKNINIKGKVTTNVSKKKLAQNSKLIESTHQTIKYKKMTERIEKISITPMQTVIKISQTYKNISLRNLCSSQDKNHISFPE